MKKKESLKELLKRLDEQSGEFNAYLYEANRLFDTSVQRVQKLLDEENKEWQASYSRMKSMIKKLRKKKGGKGKKK